jgi:hypothetical protein
MHLCIKILKAAEINLFSEHVEWIYEKFPHSLNIHTCWFGYLERAMKCPSRALSLCMFLSGAGPDRRREDCGYELSPSAMLFFCTTSG